ncbi:MAG: ATP synthase gamma chain [Deltaproteobacteria bacterium]|jgi:F-type H+-transporting ATPase subunit gamma|nr:MAG: ATP synthase gamma chain [Deltaproteobacteria bacterium]
MPSLRQIRRKISSVKGTRRIMSAMKLISAVKLQRVQGLLLAFRPYSDAFSEVAKDLAFRCDPKWHPLLRRPQEKKKLHVVFMTSDRGLCGSFNSNLIRRMETFLIIDAKAYEQVSFRFVGKRGRDHFRRQKVQIQVGEFVTAKSYIGVNERNFGPVAKEISSDLSREFAQGEVDEVILVYNYFKSALSQVITFERILPIEPEERLGDSRAIDYIYEPDREDVLNFVLPRYVETRVERALLESITSEHGARMTAMENATRNADEVVRKLTLLFNKTRQALITKELMDIVNGTEALRKGGID